LIKTELTNANTRKIARNSIMFTDSGASNPPYDEIATIVESNMTTAMIIRIVKNVVLLFSVKAK
jgi:hypothetical protein